VAQLGAAAVGRQDQGDASSAGQLSAPPTAAPSCATRPSCLQESLEMFFTRALKDGLKGQELGDQAVFGVAE
jgi:hypothetical protein